MSNDILFSLKGVLKEYRMGEVTVKALNSATFGIPKGELVVVLGPSGSGKSTLLNILGGMDISTSGKVLFNGEDISRYSDKQLTFYRRSNVGFVFQFYNLMPNLTAKENVELATEISSKPLNINEVMERVGLKDRAEHFPAQMSGGEQQRVAIARAIAKNPDVLLCDEPTGALDYSTGIKVLKLLRDINRETGKTVIIITHNQPIANMADRVIKVRSGQVVENYPNTNLMQKRIINNQRTLIGVMKALGYTDGRVLWHYTVYSLLISLIGSAAGIITGYFLGIGITSMFVQSLNIPVMTIRFYWGVVLSGTGLSAAFCLSAGVASARKVLGIQPAEAMRSEVPKAGRRIFLERIGPLWRSLRFGWKMSIRNIFRNRQRTLLTMVGISFTVVIFMVSFFLMDSINYTLVQNFFEFQRQDYKVGFSKFASYQDVLELEKIRGIEKAEPKPRTEGSLQRGCRGCRSQCKTSGCTG